MASSSSHLLLQHSPQLEISAWTRTAPRPVLWRSDPWRFHRIARTVLVVSRAEDGSASGRGREEKLWRSELLSQAESSPSSWSEESLLQRGAEEAERELQTQQQTKGRTATRSEEENGGGMLRLVGSLIEKLLVADFFFILFILAWFLAGLAEKAAFDSSSLIDAWFLFWSPVFQPALGFFMAAALWTAVSNWLKK